MSKTFRRYEPDQMLLMPVALQEWLPADHLAYFISDVVDQVDLKEILSRYEGEERGYPPYHPVMMVKVLVYAYCVGAPSSRRIEKRLHEDIAFRVLAANNTPDFRTISDFRKEHLVALGGLFLKVLELCRQAGLAKLGHVSLDGTKVKANASKHKAMSYGKMKEKRARLEAEVEELLKRAQEVDEEEDRRYGKDRRGDELPVELAFRESRLKKIREAQEALEAEAQAQGKEAPEDKAQRNFTDPDSRIMPGPGGKEFSQSYNCQAAVDSAHQVIVAADVTNQPPDQGWALPLVQQTENNTGTLPREASADAGYYSAQAVAELYALGVDPFIPPDKNWRPIRRHAEVENAIRDLKYGVGLNHMPSGRFAANGAWLAVQVMAHNLARWTPAWNGDTVGTSRSYSQASVAGGPDAKEAANPAGSAALRPEDGDGRAGVRADQTGSGLPAVSAPRISEGEVGVEANLRWTQPAQALLCPEQPPQARESDGGIRDYL